MEMRNTIQIIGLIISVFVAISGISLVITKSIYSNNPKGDYKMILYVCLAILLGIVFFALFVLASTMY